MKQRAHLSRGFTLIEVVVALAILALSLATLYESFGWGLRRSSALQTRESTWLAAESLLAEVRARSILRASEESGSTTRGEQWQVRIRPRATDTKNDYPVQAFDVDVEVTAAGARGQTVRIRSVELGRAGS